MVRRDVLIPDQFGLGLAQIWLPDDEEHNLKAWSRITPGEDGSSTIEPILVLQ